MDERDLYEILGVARSATPEEIDRAHRARVKEVHPDRGGRSQDFIDVEVAHELLSDPQRRRQYDAGMSSDTPDAPGDPWDDEEKWRHRSGRSAPSPPGRPDVGGEPPDRPYPGQPPPPGPRAHRPPPTPWRMPEPSRMPPPPASYPRARPVPTIRAGTNKWANVAVVLLFMPFVAPLAVGASLLALHQISAGGNVQRGRKRSLVVLVLSALPALAIALRLL